MQRKDVEKYSELYSKLSSMKGDIALLSAKKPNETVNEFKLKLINKLLAQINELIDKFKPEDDFDSFDFETLPTNSDVLIVLNLYLNGMERFRDANTVERLDTFDLSKMTTKEWDIND